MRPVALAVTAIVWMALHGAAGRLPPTPPYLQNGQPGEVTLVWRPAEAGAATVSLQEELGPGRMTRTVDATDQAEVRFTGLTPGTRYTYRVVQDGRVLGEGRFRANPGPAHGFMRFAVLGDMGSGGAGQHAIAHQVTRWKPDFAIAVGDLVYPSGGWEHFGPRFFAPYRELLKNTPFYPALGNHDVGTLNGAPYLAAFAVPQDPGGERYYAFDYGAARFWALDTNQPFGPGSPQYTWFAEDAARSTAKWKFAFFHHPAYSSGLHGSHPGVRQHLTPIFSRHGFAAVFAGHDHHFERSEVIDGVTYIVSGGGGAYLYGILPKRHAAAYAQMVHSYVGVTLHGDTMAIRAFDAQGQTLDAWAITRPK